MTERPILFSGPMVRAILDGKKTQTRRTINPQPIIDQGWEEPPGWALFWKKYEDGFMPKELANLCPYGTPGDRLWVRETHGINKHTGEVVFRADGGWAEAPGFKENAFIGGKWRPSIHMKRAHSRILLEIVSVRVERLQDISKADALAEGIEESIPFDENHKFYNGIGGDPLAAFKKLWSSINGAESWDANPWLWVVEFRKDEA